MVSTRITAKTIPAIELALNSFNGDMVKIEYLENCLKQMLPNDVSRFCNIKLGALYAGRRMYGPAARHMNEAAERAVTYHDKINFYLKEIEYAIKLGDYLVIDKAFKKALSCASDKEKGQIKTYLKKALLKHAEDFEKKGKNSNASAVYERVITMQIINEEERKMITEKLGVLNSKLGRIREAARYEMMAKRPAEEFKPAEEPVKKVSFDELGIEKV